MARQTKENAQETHDKILKVAANLFSTKSYHCTSLEDIAKTAKVTRGAIYWHFKNKAAIFDTLHEKLNESFLEIVLQGLAEDHPDPLLQLQDLCITLLIDLEENTEKKHALTIFLLKCDYSGELEVYRTQHRIKKDEHLKLFARYFDKVKAQKKSKYLQNIDSDILALSLSCYMKGIFSEYVDNPNNFTMVSQAPVLIKLFFHTLKT